MPDTWRSLVGPALHDAPELLWIDRALVLEAVHAYLAKGPSPIVAIDSPITCYRDNALTLAASRAVCTAPAARLSDLLTLPGLWLSHYLSMLTSRFIFPTLLNPFLIFILFPSLFLALFLWLFYFIIPFDS